MILWRERATRMIMVAFATLVVAAGWSPSPATATRQPSHLTVEPATHVYAALVVSTTSSANTRIDATSGQQRTASASRSSTPAPDRFRATKGTARARDVGRAGEDAAGIVKNMEWIPSLSGRAEYRVPDVLDRSSAVIGEVKNVSRLSYGSQLRDYAAYAQQQGYRFDLTVRRTTRLSGPLQRAVGRGEVNLRYLP